MEAADQNHQVVLVRSGPAQPRVKQGLILPILRSRLVLDDSPAFVIRNEKSAGVLLGARCRPVPRPGALASLSTPQRSTEEKDDVRGCSRTLLQSVKDCCLDKGGCGRGQPRGQNEELCAPAGFCRGGCWFPLIIVVSNGMSTRGRQEPSLAL